MRERWKEGEEERTFILSTATPSAPLWRRKEGEEGGRREGGRRLSGMTLDIFAQYKSDNNDVDFPDIDVFHDTKEIAM